MSIFRALSLLTLIILLSGCGGGSEGNEGTDSTTAADQEPVAASSDDASVVEARNFAAPTPDPQVTSILTDDGPVGSGIITDDTISFAGIGPQGASVELYLNNEFVGSALPRTDNTWVFDNSHSPLAPGDYDVSLAITGGSYHEKVYSFSYGVDIPDAPVVEGITSDTGTVDGVTSDQTLVIHGTAVPDSRVEVSLNDTPVGTVDVDANGDWSLDYTSVSLSDGLYDLSAVAIVDGDRSAVSSQYPVWIDTAPPALPVVTGISPDTGTSVSDGLTNEGQWTISGDAEAESRVDVIIDGTLVATVQSDSFGQWSYATDSAVAEGSYILTAQATDGAGNTSGLSGPYTVTVDQTALPALSNIEVQPDTGDPGDNVTSESGLIFSGSAPVAEGEVRVYLDGTLVGAAQVQPDLSWSLDNRSSSIADGSYALTAVLVDDAGNPSAEYDAGELTVDTSVPAIPTLVGVTEDTGTDGDFVTRDNQLEFYGTAEQGTEVDLFIDGTLTGSAVVDGSENWSVDNTASVIPGGSYSLTVQARDASGNTSPLSGPITLTVDTGTVVPAVTGIEGDTGVDGDGITRDPTLLIRGTAEPGAQVVVYVDGSSVGSQTADGGGNWTFDYTATALPEGSYAVTAQATDLAGNISTESSAFSLTIDESAPAAPVVTDIADDTGTAGDGITSDTTLIFSGTAEADASVEVFIDGGSIGSVTADGSGNWSFDHTGTALAEGAYTVNAEATDAAGNTSAVSADFDLTIDTSATAAPVVTGIMNDTGLDGSDGVTSDTTLIFTGTSEADADVEVFVDGGSIGTTTADGSGNWSYDHSTTPLGEGTYTITAQATGAAGNTSAMSGDFALTIDTSIPAAPAVSGITDDTGTNGDGITSDTTLIFDGTSEANASVEVFIDDSPIGTATADGSGNWSFDHTGITLGEGSYIVTAQATDAAGNASAVSADFDLTIDTSATAAPEITAITDDTGSDGSDGITSDTTLVFSGTAEADASVEVFIDGGSIGSVTADGSGNWSLDYTATPLGEGDYIATAEATDAAGNTSVPSADFALTIDASVPSAPAVTDIADDTGTAGDGITSDTTLIFDGTSEANASVEVFIDGGPIGTATADGSGNWSYDHTDTALGEGSHTVTAQATDAAGNTSSMSTDFALVIDTSDPSAPVVAGITDDTGTAGDGITSDTTLVFNGTAEADASVAVFIDGGPIGTATADGSGNWSFDHTGITLGEGSYIVTAQATDAAGNASAVSADFDLTIDTSATAAPEITAITDDTGSDGSDGITSDTTLVFSGTAEADASVEVFIDGGSVGSVTADGSGNWSFDYTATPLGEGSYTLTARATDAAGNASGLSVGLAVTIDTSAPAAPSVSGITDDTGTAGDGITSDTTLSFAGTSDPNASVEVFLDGGSIGTTTADGSGNWSFDYSATPLGEGSYTLTAQASDAAGNISSLSGGLPFTIDTSISDPVVSSITDDTGTAGDEITSDTTLSFAGTSDPSASVEVFLDGGLIGTTTSDGSGNWSFDYTATPLGEGSYTLTAQASDAAGNISNVSAGLPFTIDTSISDPVVSSITDDTGTAGDEITSDTTLSFVGSSDANVSVEVFLDGGSIGTTTADGSGNWSFDYTATPLAEGSYTLTARATDTAGNSSNVSAGLPFTIDTSISDPVVTTITDDTGTTGDEITSDTSLSFAGTSDPSTTVEVFLDGGSIGTTTADGSGNWSFDYTGTTLVEGSYTLTARATDTAGNTSNVSTGLPFIIDASINDPVVTGITDDTGTAGDEITSDTTLSFSGTSDANVSVEIFLDGGSIGTTTADGSGNWSFDYTATPLVEGSYTLTARATDTAGNSSNVSAGLPFTIDSSISDPAVTGITDDTGTAGDEITSDTTLSFAGTSDSSASVEVFLDGGSIGTTTADGSGNWSFDYTAMPLGEGTYTLTAQASDAAGNSSNVSAGLPFTIDTSISDPVVSSITDDTGTAGDEITSDTTLSFAGTSDANVSVEVFLDGGSIGTTTSDGSGNWSLDYTATPLGEGSYTLTALATDTAGNVSNPSAGLPFTIDTTINDPSVTTITDDTGTAGDEITSDTTLSFAGTSDANATVEVFLDGGSIGTTTADGSGNWSFDYTGTTLVEGSYTLTAQASDAAGNTSNVSAGLPFTIDTSITDPTVTGITDDTGTAGDEITSDTTLSFAGTSDASATVEVFLDGGSIGTTTADGSGNWSFDYTGTPLGEGSYILTAQATDTAGNTSALSAGLAVTVDTSAPAITSYTPANGATGVALTQNLAIDTDEAVSQGAGNWVIYNQSDDSVFETIPVGDPRISGYGTSTLTLDPSSNLVGGSQYYLEIDPDAFADAAGNLFGGIAGNGTWSLTTEDFALSSTSPADGATGVVLDSTLVFTFNEPGFVGTGNVVVRRTSDNSVYDTIDVTSGAVTGGGSTDLEVTLSDTLEPNTDYYIEVDAGAFENANGAGFAGISGSTTFNFTTVNVNVPTVTNVTSPVADGTYRGGDVIPLEVTFSEVVNVAGTPRIQLDLDGSDKYVSYTSGSGSNTLTFEYTVATGDEAADLGYVATNSLVRNDGSIRSVNNANADLTLPSPGAASSLSANKDIAIVAASLDMSSFNSSDGFIVSGYEAGDQFGRGLGGGGDFNGDGFEDFVVGVSLSDITAGDAGAAYVIFGKAGATRSDFAVDTMAADDGFLISGAAGADYLGMTVDLSGDLNGDGYDDAVIIASNDNTGGSDAGRAYVIWGQAGSTHPDVDVSAMGATDGFSIIGYESADSIGDSTVIDPQNSQFLDVGGDFNGDGIGDLVLGHSESDQPGANSGVVYVIFGQTGSTRADIDLSALGANGIRMTTGGATEEYFGHSVQFVSDFNGDGLNDIVIGAPRSDEVAGDAGQAYVVFGTTTPTDVDIAAMTDTEGFAIQSTEGASWLGGSVGSSDVNGDGLSDLVIGNVASNDGLGDSGSIVVIYGYNTTNYPDLTFGSIPGSSGYTIFGEDTSDFVGHAVEGAGDVNGDGVDDILASTWVDDEGGGDAGAAWLIYGKTGTARSNIQLGSLTSADGFKVIGDQAVDYFGRTNAVGDINGDGYRDLLVSSALGDNTGADTGEVNVIWGKDFLSVVDTNLTGTTSADILVGTDGDDTISGMGGADRISAGAGNDLLEVADLGFARLDGGRGQDAIVLAGSSLSLDLRSLGVDVIRGIELIDLNGGGNGLTLDTRSLLALSDESRVLYVKGTAADFVALDSGETWSSVGTVVVDSVTYHQYDRSEVSLYVQDGMSQPEPPAAPTVDSFSVDTGTTGDGITSDTGLVFSGTSGAFHDVEVFLDGGSIGTTTADSGGNWSFDYSATVLGEGTYAITARATNLGGYESVDSSALSVTIDTGSPTPSVDSVSTDTALADAVTSDTTLIYNGSAAEAGAVVEVFRDGVSLGTTTADGSGNWSLDDTGTVLAEGSYAITAQATDDAGNTSAVSGSLTVVVDTSEASPVVTGVSDDTGIADDGVTNDPTLFINGTSNPGTSIEVFRDGVSLGTVSADGSGNWTYNNTASSLTENTYSFTARATDLAGNTSAESSGYAVTLDLTAPTLSTLSPVDGATDVPLGANLELSFSEAVYAGSGNITILRTGDDSVFEQIPVGDARVSGSGTATVTVNPTSDLEIGTDYYVQLDGTALVDHVDNAYAGIADKTTWNFTSESPLLLSSSTPADDSTGIALDSDLTLTFNRAAYIGSGDVRLRRTSDDSLVEAVNVSSGQVTGAGTTTVTISFSDYFEPNTGYYIEVDGTAFEDVDAKTYAGIADSTTLNFTSANVTIPTVTGVSSTTADGTYVSGQVIAIDVTFSETVNVTGIPRIQVNLDGQDKYINYSSGSGTSTLTFNYTVTPGDVAADLGYVDASSLILNGGSIRGNDLGSADLTLPDPGTAGSLSANKALVVDAYVLDITGMSAANGFFIRGHTADEEFGQALDGAGDVNGDGYEDILFSITDYNGEGSAWLIFGKDGATRSNINLGSLTSGDGIVFTPPNINDYLGAAVAVNGDLNGDGYDEIIMASPHELSLDGRVYVVWGKSGISGLDFSTGWSAADGFRIDGVETNEHFTSQRVDDADNGAAANPLPLKLMDASGDFNGDGYNDLLIGHHIQDVDANDDIGVVWVILGQSGASRSDISLGSVGSQGFRITNSGGIQDGYLGSHVRFIGDYNGDGYNDIFIGEVGNGAGRAYVVFGKPGSGFSNIDLASLDGTNGFALTTGISGSRLASGMDSKDINGDGLSDLVIGQQYASPNSRATSGRVIVIYGHSSGGPYPDIDVDSVSGSAGFVIEGETAGDEFGHATCLGDVDADGIDDLVLTSRTDSEGGSNAGAAWVIYGKSGTARSSVDLATLTSVDGFKIVGDTGGDEFGTYCTLADLNGDGYQDMAFVSPFGDDNASNSGETNVVWGRDFQAKTYGNLTGNGSINHIVGTSASDTIDALGGADTVSAGRSDDISYMGDVSFARVTGGRGLDTLALAMNGLTLDLTSLGYHVVQDIEVIDLSDLNNTLILSALDVLALSREGSELYVMGGSSDAVSDASGPGTWTAAGSTTIGAVTYNIYTSGGATLYVESTLSQGGL